MRPVAKEEKRILENRMMWVLTGEDKFWKDSITIDNENAVRKQNERAHKKMAGTTRIKKRKGKSSHFDTRKKKTKNENRKTLSNSKSDSKFDLDHNPDEADDSDE
jgi:U3 small nucleolar RNA-associated protein 14